MAGIKLDLFYISFNETLARRILLNIKSKESEAIFLVY